MNTSRNEEMNEKYTGRRMIAKTVVANMGKKPTTAKTKKVLTW
jgi:hypothetical protein